MLKKVLKTIFTSFIFYFMLLSLGAIYTHYSGGDSKGIVLIWLNPILSKLCYTSFAENVLSAGPMIKCDTIAGEISLYWYIAHFITFVIYGGILDLLKFIIKKVLRKPTSTQTQNPAAPANKAEL